MIDQTTSHSNYYASEEAVNTTLNNSKDLLDRVQELAKSGKIEEAIKEAEEAKLNETLYTTALRSISQALLNNNFTMQTISWRVDKVIEVTGMIPNKRTRDLSFQNISKLLMNKGFKEEAIKVADMIQNPDLRNQTHQEIRTAEEKKVRMKKMFNDNQPINYKVT